MVKTTKTSIKAIIFVTIYFLFIIFISTFKGITLYNLRFHNINIDKIFIKLNKKIILKIDNIKIQSNNNYKKEALNIHKTFYILTKLLPFFQKIEINKIYQNNILLLKRFILDKEKFFINSKNLIIKGNFRIYKKYSKIYINYIKYLHFIFKNSSILAYYTKNYVFINIKTFLNKNPLFFALKANDNNIYYSIQSKKISIPYNDLNINLLNIEANGEINNYFTFYNAKFNAKKCNINNKDFNIKINKINGNIKNDIINLTLSTSTVQYPTYFKNLNLNNTLLTFNIKNYSIASFTKKIILNYKKYILNADNVTFNYYLKTKNFFLHGKNLKINNDINISNNEFLISKLPKIYFYFQNNKIAYKYFNLSNKNIKGNKKFVLLTDVIGKVLGFDTNISSPKISINQKYVVSNKIFFNKIPFSKTKFIFNKKPYILTSSTNTLFNKNVKEILKKFKINIPFTQIKGDNNLSFKVYINNQFDNIKYNLKSKNSYFNLKDINFSYSALNIQGDLNISTIFLKNFKFPYQYLNTNLDSNITLNLKDKYINSFTYIKKLNIGKYLNIKNFNEKIVINLKNKFIYLLNSAIFANLNNNTIYLYSLKNLLKYSIFNKLFDNGTLLIKFLKNNKIYIKANVNFKYPIILNSKNPHQINIESIIQNNNILIKNQNINTKIINFEKIYSNIDNLDINIEGLIQTINAVEEIIEKINTNKKQSNNQLKVFITSTNTNFVYKNHKFLTNKAQLIFDNNEINFSATYKKSHLKGYTKNNYLLIEGKNYTKKVLLPLLSFFNHFYNINLDFVLVRSPQNFYTGKIYIKSGSVKDLGTLNNIIAFINTIPALLTLNTPGFSSKGYHINNGYISYLFYKNILYLKKIIIKGTNLDFYGKGYVNLNKNYIKMKINTVVKIKLKKIPILGKALSYILFGKDGYLHINIFIHGNLNNPEVSKDLGGGVIETPLKLFKRVLTLPFNIF